MWKYILTLATAFLALLQLAKDWGAHQTTSRRAAVLCLIVVLGIGGSINIYYSDKRATQQHGEDEKKIAGLQKAAETANAAQESNTKQFLHSFNNLSQQLSGLETQVKTANLQKEAARLRAELELTQKALVPRKAVVEASLGDVTETLQNMGVKEIPVQRQLDGTVAFTVNVINKSDVQAKNGSIFLRLCQKCEYSEEPKRFQRPVGAENYDREMIFQAINATTGISIPLRVKPPDIAHRFQLDVTVRCETCAVRPKDILYIDY